MRCAALYVDPRGPYPKIDGVDCWDEIRDAENYPGPWPVVAHPPCGPWGKLRHLYKGREHPLALIAAMQVRKFGGVLEHPAGSRLWAAAGLPLPDGTIDMFGGFTLQVNQVEWGHVARKATWLYLCRVSGHCDPPYPGTVPTHWVGGGRNTVRGNIPAGIKACSSQQKRRTPPLFAEMLVRLAESAK